MTSTYIIAEAGVNHNGDIEIAKKLIYKAKEIGADAVKFQTFKSEKLVSYDASKADYQIRNTKEAETQLDMLKKLELTYDQFIILAQYATDLGIDFLSTPFDLDSVDFLSKLNMKYWKIPSGELTNKPYLEAISNTRKPIIISTGMSNLDEIEETLNLFRDYNKENITLLHCNTEYPTPYHDVNLRAMNTLHERFQVKVGYSDHTLGIEVAIAAVALGASVIEKHFTLDNKMLGPDHKASLEPMEFSNMVRAIRNIEKSLGNGEKKPSHSELKNINIARKSIVANRDIIKDEIFTIDNITTKRPGDGLSPMKWNTVLGLKAKRNFKKDEKIEI